VTGIVTVVGYPVTYYLARLESTLLRRSIIVILLASLWITYVIRAYAWTVLLSRDGLVSQLAVALKLIAQPQSFVPGYGALLIALVYVLLPFYILTLYPSIRNIDSSLIEASKNLGAGPLRTFLKVTFPLSKAGVIAGGALIYILTTGAFVLPTMLGSPTEWTLAVIIGMEINQELNVPFASAMSIVLMIVVVLLLVMTLRLTTKDLLGLGGGPT
jgi:ABC-type spermidine/putrescine transport system permease subunit I